MDEYPHGYSHSFKLDAEMFEAASVIAAHLHKVTLELEKIDAPEMHLCSNEHNGTRACIGVGMKNDLDNTWKSTVASASLRGEFTFKADDSGDPPVAWEIRIGFPIKGLDDEYGPWVNYTGVRLGVDPAVDAARIVEACRDAGKLAGAVEAMVPSLIVQPVKDRRYES